jgi:hypothetical protein
MMQSKRCEGSFESSTCCCPLAIRLDEVQSTVEFIHLLHDNHPLLPAVNLFRRKVMGRMSCAWSTLGTSTSNQESSSANVDFEVLINKMPKVLKELPCQGEVLFHLKVLCLIKPCQCVQINEGTSGMLLQKIHPKHKGLI